LKILFDVKIHKSISLKISHQLDNQPHRALGAGQTFIDQESITVYI